MYTPQGRNLESDAQKRKLTPGRKIGEWVDWDGNTVEIPDPSLESGLNTKIIINGEC